MTPLRKTAVNAVTIGINIPLMPTKLAVTGRTHAAESEYPIPGEVFNTTPSLSPSFRRRR
jgi:hypothetical protein